MEERELIRTLTIPMYRRDYTMSNSMTAKYFEKGRKNKIPVEYCNKERFKADNLREPDGVKYGWREFPVVRKKVKCLVDFLINIETGERIIANPNQVGKPRVNNINGQQLYNGFISKHARNNMIGTIKDQLRQYIMSCPVIDRFPLIIEAELWDTVIDNDFSNGQDWDVLNRFFPYAKAFEDVLKKGTSKNPGCGIIPEDDRMYITKPPATIFCPVDTTEQRKLVFNIYVDRRPIILNNKLYQQKHGTKLG